MHKIKKFESKIHIKSLVKNKNKTNIKQRVESIKNSLCDFNSVSKDEYIEYYT